MAEPIGKIRDTLKHLQDKTPDALKTGGVIDKAQKDIMDVLNKSPLSLKLNDLGAGELSKVAELDDAWKGAYEYLDKQQKDIKKKYDQIQSDLEKSGWKYASGSSTPKKSIADNPIEYPTIPPVLTITSSVTDPITSSLEVQKILLRGTETRLLGEITTAETDGKKDLVKKLHIELKTCQDELVRVAADLLIQAKEGVGDQKRKNENEAEQLKELKKFKEAYDELQPILTEMDTTLPSSGTPPPATMTNYQKVHAVAEKLKLWKSIAPTEGQKTWDIGDATKIIGREKIFFSGAVASVTGWPTGGITSMLSFSNEDGDVLPLHTAASGTTPDTYIYRKTHNTKEGKQVPIDIVIPQKDNLSAADIKIYETGITPPKVLSADKYPVQFDLKVACKRDDTAGTGASGAVYENSQKIAFTLNYPIPGSEKIKQDMESIVATRHADIERTIQAYMNNNSAFKSTLQVSMIDSIKNNGTIKPDDQKKYITHLKRNRKEILSDTALGVALRPGTIATLILQNLSDSGNDANIYKSLLEQQRVKDILVNKDASTLPGALTSIIDKMTISSAGKIGDKYASFRPTLMVPTNAHFAEAVCDYMSSATITTISKDKVKKAPLPVPTDMTREIVLNDEYKIAFHPKYGAYPMKRSAADSDDFLYPERNEKNANARGWVEADSPKNVFGKKKKSDQTSTTPATGESLAKEFEKATVGNIVETGKAIGEIDAEQGILKGMSRLRNIGMSTKAALHTALVLPDTLAASAGAVGKVLKLIKGSLDKDKRWKALGYIPNRTGHIIDNKVSRWLLKWGARTGGVLAFPRTVSLGIAGAIVGGGAVINGVKQTGKKALNKFSGKKVDTRGKLGEKFPDFKTDYIDKIDVDEHAGGDHLAESSLNALYTTANVKLLHERCKMPGVYTSIGSDKKFYYVINDAGKLSCGVIDNPKLIDPELTKRLGMGELNEPRFSPNNVLIQRNPLTKILRKIKKTNIISPRERITEIGSINSHHPGGVKEYGELPKADAKKYELGPYEEWITSDPKAITQLIGL